MKNMQQTAAAKRKALPDHFSSAYSSSYFYVAGRSCPGGTEALYTVSQEDNTIFLQKDGEELTFWEAPTVTARPEPKRRYAHAAQ